MQSHGINRRLTEIDDLGVHTIGLLHSHGLRHLQRVGLGKRPNGPRETQLPIESARGLILVGVDIEVDTARHTEGLSIVGTH